ncbi:MAG: NB-ARC domain-containing protein [Cyanobacteria bacterium P01_D01_bin.115]
MNRSPKRYRGIVLTQRGVEQLESAIAAAQGEEKYGQRFTQAELSERACLSIKTIKKIRGRTAPVDETSVRTFFKAFGLELETADYGLPEPTSPVSDHAPTSQEKRLTTKCDWGEKPDTTIFFGRMEELATLGQWVMTEQCRLVTLLGMGGIGKTSLAAKLADQIYEQFDYVIWRSLREAPPLDEILVRLIQFLSDQQETAINLPTRLGERIIRLLHYLREHRCLLLLDNLESILQAESAGHYREGYEDYGELIQHISSAEHQSCLLLTSRECPRELAPMAGDRLPVRLWSVGGIDTEAGREILKTKGLELDETASQSQELIRRYSGNPQALHLVATAIQREFLGDVDDFLEEEGAAVEDVWSLLGQHLSRLAPLERSILFWLAINREPVGLEELMEDLLPPMTKREVRRALRGLSDRYLIETVGKQFTLQNVIMEFATDRFVEQVNQELNTQKFDLLHTHALIKATSKDYVRETQLRLIQKPIAADVTNADVTNLVEQVSQALAIARQHPKLQDGYMAGNLLNLLCRFQAKVRNLDFSGLTLRQIYLTGVQLHALNLANTQWVTQTLTHPFGRAGVVIFSPNGQWLAAGNTDATVRLWELSTGKCHQTLIGHTASVNSVAFSPNGQWLASGSRDATIRLWELSTSKCYQTLIEHTATVNSVAFSPDGQWLASASSDATIRLWRISDGSCHQTLTGHNSWVTSIAFSPDGQWLATGSGDRTVRLWNASTGKWLMTFTGHTRSVKSVAFSPDGRWLASGSRDATTRLWKISTGECFKTLTGHTRWVNSVMFSPDGRRLVTGSSDATIRLWQLSTGECYETLTGHTAWVRSVAFSLNGQWLATSSDDATIRIWQVNDCACYQTLTSYTEWVNSVAFSPDGFWLASASSDAVVRLWRIRNGEYCKTFIGHTGLVDAVTFSPDGKWLVTGSGDASVRLWQISDGSCCRTLTNDMISVSAVIFSPDGKLLATGSYDANARLWNINDGECLQVLVGHTDWIKSVAFSPDGQWLATGSIDTTIRLWQVSTGICCQVFVDSDTWVHAVAFSPDGQWLATGSGDATMRLWKVGITACQKKLEGHTDWITSVAFSPDGKWLASGSSDSTARLWQVSTGKCHQIFTGHAAMINSVAFSPNGRWLATSSSDSTVRLWQISTGECLKVLRIPRPYEGTDITGATGLTDTQRASMLALGAVNHSSES